VYLPFWWCRDERQFKEMELKLTHLSNDNNRYRRERERLEEILQSTQVGIFFYSVAPLLA
jgi:hypothetical protein